MKSNTAEVSQDHHNAARKLQSGFRSIKPSPALRKFSGALVIYRIDIPPTHVGIAYWTKPSPSARLYPVANICVHADLLKSISYPGIHWDGHFKILFDEAMKIYRLEMCPWTEGWKSEPFRRGLFSRVKFDLTPEMPLSIEESPIFATNVSVSDNGINFTLKFSQQ